MSMQQEPKYCAYCDKQIKGRTDKRFCNDWCRGSYHYENNRSTATLVHAINLNLRRNRKVLQSFLPHVYDTVEVEKERAKVYGFDFTYFTHLKVVKDIPYYFCYDYAYRIVDADTIEIVHQKSLVEIQQSPSIY